MDLQKLTKEQAVIISGFTGILCSEFSDFHADVEKRLGRGVQTFEFSIKSFITEVKKLYEADFIKLVIVDDEPAKAQAVPEGFVLVEKKNTEDWYLDDCEGMWWDHDGIDGSLCELDIGEVQAVEHKEYLITENNTLYATRVWDDANDQVDCWQFFKTKEEAEKAAAYCKAKFYEEAREPTND